ncbi:hypothetical protein WBP07_07220 [Novosphingobium sp. BL-8A]
MAEPFAGWATWACDYVAALRWAIPHPRAFPQLSAEKRPARNGMPFKRTPTQQPCRRLGPNKFKIVATKVNESAAMTL